VGLAEKGKGAVDSLAIGTLNGVADMLQLVAPSEVYHLPLEAAMKADPFILVFQRKHKELIHEVTGPGGTAIGVGSVTDTSAYWGPRRQDTIGGLPHTKQLGNRIGYSNILGVHHALVGLHVEATWGREVDHCVNACTAWLGVPCRKVSCA
jgi:hypothetical protein